MTVLFCSLWTFLFDFFTIRVWRIRQHEQNERSRDLSRNERLSLVWLVANADNSTRIEASTHAIVDSSNRVLETRKCFSREIIDNSIILESSILDYICDTKETFAWYLRMDWDSPKSYWSGYPKGRQGEKKEKKMRTYF